jgi:NAD(P)-dependent dehydrogenase (short-subunit alcohol dehydrogenase family)
MPEDLRGKAALVTGAGSGIGRAASLKLAEAGARVVVADLNEESARSTAARILDGGGEATAVRVDVAKAAEVAAMVEVAMVEFGGLDVAVNNAGVGGAGGRTHEQEEADWQRTLAVNLTGVWLSMKYELPPMLERGAGSIVNVASVAGVVGFPRHCAYSASKHGVIGLTRSAALEYARKGIRVNAVCPAFTDTPMVEAMLESADDLRPRLEAAIPLGRFGRPEEVADAILYLCSARAGFVTGQTLVLDGGLTAG